MHEGDDGYKTYTVVHEGDDRRVVEEDEFVEAAVGICLNRFPDR